MYLPVSGAEESPGSYPECYLKMRDILRKQWVRKSEGETGLHGRACVHAPGSFRRWTQACQQPRPRCSKVRRGEFSFSIRKGQGRDGRWWICKNEQKFSKWSRRVASGDNSPHWREEPLHTVGRVWRIVRSWRISSW